jgi:hypothetical protein
VSTFFKSGFTFVPAPGPNGLFHTQIVHMDGDDCDLQVVGHASLADEGAETAEASPEVQAQTFIRAPNQVCVCVY